MIYITNSPSQTEKLGESSALNIIVNSEATEEKKAVTIGLEGDLGGGKTTFVKGFAKGLGIKERILSPTFVIIKKFPIPKYRKQQQKSRFERFYHIDCYRIDRPEEILRIGFQEIISDPQNIVVIEWAEKIKKLLPGNTLIVKFEFLGKNKRKLTSNRKLC